MGWSHVHNSQKLTCGCLSLWSCYLIWLGKSFISFFISSSCWVRSLFYANIASFDLNSRIPAFLCEVFLLWFAWQSLSAILSIIVTTPTALFSIKEPPAVASNRSLDYGWSLLRKMWIWVISSKPCFGHFLNKDL